MKKRLQETFAKLFPAEEFRSVYNAFDIIGDIAIIKLPHPSTARAANIAKTIMNRHRSVKTVLAQTSGIAGDFRLRSLRHVAGEHKTVAVHKESGCSFAVDVASCYFSPRLLNERQRIARLVQPGEVAVNMFAGVGCFSIIIAKEVPTAKVFSIDVNTLAVEFMKENIRRNRVFGRVIPFLGDAKAIIETRLQRCADRVLMPLPEKAFSYLPSALSALKTTSGWVHIYAFEHALKTENAKDKVKQTVTEKFRALGADFEVAHVRIVRSTGPNWFQLVADVHTN